MFVYSVAATRSDPWAHHPLSEMWPDHAGAGRSRRELPRLRLARSHEVARGRAHPRQEKSTAPRSGRYSSTSKPRTTCAAAPLRSFHFDPAAPGASRRTGTRGRTGIIPRKRSKSPRLGFQREQRRAMRLAILSWSFPIPNPISTRCPCRSRRRSRRESWQRRRIRPWPCRLPLRPPETSRKSRGSSTEP